MSHHARRRAFLALAAFAVPTFLVATSSEALTPSLDDTQWSLAGNIRGRIVRLGGTRDTATINLSLDTEGDVRTFTATDDDFNTYTGEWLYGNRPGTRIRFTFDETSSQLLDTVIEGIIADASEGDLAGADVDAIRTAGTGRFNPRKRRLSLKLLRTFRVSHDSLRRPRRGVYLLRVTGFEPAT